MVVAGQFVDIPFKIGHAPCMNYTEIELKLVSDPENTIEDICASVSGGGTLPEWCDLHKVRFGVIAGWINQTPPLLTLYGRATVMRGEWFEQTIYRELRGIATLDVRGMLDEDGTIKPVSEWPDSLARSVAGLEHTEAKGESGVNKKVKLLDKLKALELLMKSRRMLSERVEHTGRVTLEQLVEDSKDAKPNE
jgi:hypothetical protein